MGCGCQKQEQKPIRQTIVQSANQRPIVQPKKPIRKLFL
jgi:hypothetical protein